MPPQAERQSTSAGLRGAAWRRAVTGGAYVTPERRDDNAGFVNRRATVRSQSLRCGEVRGALD